MPKRELGRIMTVAEIRGSLYVLAWVVRDYAWRVN